MLRGRIGELTAARVRYGYFQIYILLLREGWRINHKAGVPAVPAEGLSMWLKRAATSPDVTLQLQKEIGADNMSSTKIYVKCQQRFAQKLEGRRWT